MACARLNSGESKQAEMSVYRSENLVQMGEVLNLHGQPGLP
jgi:hypothetical protein